MPARALPWEAGDQPRLAALFSTIGRLLLHPGPAYQAMEREGWHASLGFGLITGSFGLLAVSYTQLLLSLSLRERLAQMQGWGEAAFSGVQGILVLMLCTPAIVLMSLLLGSLTLLPMLWLWGRPASFTLALRISSYAQAGLVLAVVPVLGALVGVSWSLYLKVKGVQNVFGLSGLSSWIVVLLALFLEAFLLLAGLVALTVSLVVTRIL
jgi:hypothetical protein